MQHKSVLWLLAMALLIIGPLLTACGGGAPAPAPTPPAPTPAPAPAPVATVIPHTLEGRDNCLLCHEKSGIKPFPADHAGRSSDTCTTCHQTA